MLFSLPCSNNEKAWHRGGAGAINDAVEREKTAFLTDTNLGGPRSELMTPYNEPHTDVNTGILGAGPNEAAIATKTLVRTLVGGKVGSLVWSKIACGIVAHCTGAKPKASS